MGGQGRCRNFPKNGPHRTRFVFKSNSIIFRTGQAWKYWPMLIGTVFGMASLMAAQWFKDSSVTPSFFYIASLWASIVLLAAGLIFPVLAIRCPRCKARWLWRLATTGESVDWWERFNQTNCPKCGYDGNTWKLREAPKNQSTPINRG